MGTATLNIPTGFRRSISAALAAIITFIIIRILFNMEISLKLALITLISAGLGSIISKELHKYIVKEEE